MAVINTGLLTKGVLSTFHEALRTIEPRFSQWSTRVESTTDSENHRWLGTVPNMREWGTGRLAKGLRSEAYNIENLKYELTIEVDRDEISDDQTGTIRLRVQEMARRAALHKDFLIGQLLINGANAGFTSYDDVTFFNTTHSSGDSGNQSNLLTPAAADADNPTVPECKTAIQNAIGTMMDYNDDNGQPSALDMNGLVVVCHPLVQWPFREALNSALISNTDNVLKGVADVIPYPYLTEEEDFFLLKISEPLKPFIFQDREPIEVTSLDTPDTDEAFNREKYLYGVRGRYRMAFGEWRYCIKSTFTE